MGLAKEIGPRYKLEPLPRKYFDVDRELYPDGVAFADLKRGQCSYILGRDRMDNSGVCCGEAAKEGSPYCAEHHARCYWRPDPNNPRAGKFILKNILKGVLK